MLTSPTQATSGTLDFTSLTRLDNPIQSLHRSNPMAHTNPFTAPSCFQTFSPPPLEPRSLQQPDTDLATGFDFTPEQNLLAELSQQYTSRGIDRKSIRFEPPMTSGPETSSLTFSTGSPTSSSSRAPKCGKCRTCRNPRLKKACLTARAAQANQSSSASSSPSSSPHPMGHLERLMATTTALTSSPLQNSATSGMQHHHQLSHTNEDLMKLTQDATAPNHTGLPPPINTRPANIPTPSNMDRGVGRPFTTFQFEPDSPYSNQSSEFDDSNLNLNLLDGADSFIPLPDDDDWNEAISFDSEERGQISGAATEFRGPDGLKLMEMMDINSKAMQGQGQPGQAPSHHGGLAPGLSRLMPMAGLARPSSMPDLSNAENFMSSPFANQTPESPMSFNVGRNMSGYAMSENNSPLSGMSSPFSMSNLSRENSPPFSPLSPQPEIPLDNIARMLEINSAPMQNTLNINAMKPNDQFGIQMAANPMAGMDRKWPPSRLSNMSVNQPDQQDFFLATNDRMRQDATMGMFNQSAPAGSARRPQMAGAPPPGMNVVGMQHWGLRGMQQVAMQSAMADPRSQDQLSAKRMSRIMANRLSAAKSRVKKLQQTADLEEQVRQLQSVLANTHTKTETCKERRINLNNRITQIKDEIEVAKKKKASLDQAIASAQEELKPKFR